MISIRTMAVLTILGAQILACSSGPSSTGSGGAGGGPGSTGSAGGSGGAGVGGAGGVPFEGVACDQPAGGSHVCMELLSDKLGCPGGSTMLSACPREGLIGICATPQSGNAYKQYFYEGGDVPPDALKGYCAQSGGTWSDG
ncbi:hypothetical protein A7982_13327 [Minicystis rosea]|nr:hypothetical protein A7982_13327 [Minicystis rosea]